MYFSKQKHSGQLVVCLNTYTSIKKILHYNIEVYELTNAGYKYSDVVNDLNWDVAVTCLSFVRLALTGN